MLFISLERVSIHSRHATVTVQRLSTAATHHCGLLLQVSCMQAQSSPSLCRVMAEKRYIVREAIDELEGSDFDVSEDHFEGYLDIDGHLTAGRTGKEQGESRGKGRGKCWSE